MVKLPLRTIEVAAIEHSGPPYARVTIVTSIEGARHLARFMTDGEVPAHWVELKTTQPDEDAVLPDIEVNVDNDDQ